MFNFHLCCGLLMLVLSAQLRAADMPQLQATASDPGSTCSVLDQGLPDTLSAIRHIGKLRKEKAIADTEYCAGELQTCAVHTMEFSGLALDLLVRKQTQKASVLIASVSRPQWKLFGNIRTGQPLEVVEKHYGVTIPRNASPIRIEGECTPLTVWHVNGRVTKLLLDCQACI